MLHPVHLLLPPACMGNMQPGCDVFLSVYPFVCLSVIIDQEPVATRVLPVGGTMDICRNGL